MSEKEINSIGFDCNGKNYVIKVFHIGNNYIVESCLDGVVLNSYSCPVLDSINKKDWENHFGDKPPYVKLIEIAKDDIQKGYGIRKAITP